jgi:hypothetical protein
MCTYFNINRVYNVLSPSTRDACNIVHFQVSLKHRVGEWIMWLDPHWPMGKRKISTHGVERVDTGELRPCVGCFSPCTSPPSRVETFVVFPQTSSNSSLVDLGQVLSPISISSCLPYSFLLSLLIDGWMQAKNKRVMSFSFEKRVWIGTWVLATSVTKSLCY